MSEMGCAKTQEVKGVREIISVYTAIITHLLDNKNFLNSI